jgi:outer membrane protein assembly factor BamE (lipoprotein component of BamABCDE complex)
MKTKKLLSIGVVSLLLVGCATTFRPWKLSDVQENMTKDQVVSILGKPDSVVQSNGMECLYYTYSKDYNPSPGSDVSLDVTNPQMRWQAYQIKQSTKKERYVVKIVDGKVLSYEEITK